jgi:hypothetical protein
MGWLMAERTEMMNTRLSTEELAHLGGGIIGYVREIEPKTATKLLGELVNVPPQARLFCLYNADGTPISISGSREAALGDAAEHDLIPASVH